MSDDGIGFDAGSFAAVDPERSASGSFGLRAMRERVDQLGGSLAIDAAPRRGVTLRVQLPVVAQ